MGSSQSTVGVASGKIPSTRKSSIQTSRKLQSHKTLKKNDALIVKIMMPLYYTEETVRFQDVFDAKLSWEKIVTNNSREFHARKEELPFENSRAWFEASFYQRLFDVHPFCKKLFRDPSSQGKFLVSFFSFIFTVMDDETAFNDRLVSLAESHNQRGIKSTEYSVIGSVLFYTLRICLGAEYDGKTHDAWVKIFSKILAVMIPVAVAYELKNNDLQKQRVAHFYHEMPTPSTTGGNASGVSSCPFNENIIQSNNNRTKKIFDEIQIREIFRRRLPLTELFMSDKSSNKSNATSSSNNKKKVKPFEDTTAPASGLASPI